MISSPAAFFRCFVSAEALVWMHTEVNAYTYTHTIPGVCISVEVCVSKCISTCPSPLPSCLQFHLCYVASVPSLLLCLLLLLSCTFLPFLSSVRVTASFTSPSSKLIIFYCMLCFANAMFFYLLFVFVMSGNVIFVVLFLHWSLFAVKMPEWLWFYVVWSQCCYGFFVAFLLTFSSSPPAEAGKRVCS